MAEKQKEMERAAEAHVPEHGSARVPAHDAHGHGDRDAMFAEYRLRFFVSLFLTIPIALLSSMVQHWFGLEALAFPGSAYVLFALATVVYVYGGYPFLSGALAELGRANPGMMTLVAVAITTAWAWSTAVTFGVPGEEFFWELATLVDIMLLGHWLEMRSVLGASRALEALAELMPDTAHRLRPDGSTEDVPAGDLDHGDRIVVRPGERVPADGAIVGGRSSIDESMLTGESVPVDKESGAEAIAGSINGDGALTVEVRKTGKETYLSQVMALVEEAQRSRSRTENLADRAARWLTVVALGGGAITLVAWLALGETTSYAVERAVTVMVIACPHALGLAIPLVVAVSTAIGAQAGILVRNRAHFERARDVDAVFFDKTGTLTKGIFGVRSIVVPEGIAETDVLRLAASLDQYSEHPIARGVVAAARERNLALAPAADFEAVRGVGVRGVVEGRKLALTSPAYLATKGIEIPTALRASYDRSGVTVVTLTEGDRILGAISLVDIVRPESREAIARLKAMGVRAMMITGDRRPVAEAVAREVGLDEVFAEVLPGEKAQKIDEVRSRGFVVAMTGDGVNDAPALAKADVAIAVGAGTDVAIQTADVILARNDPRDVVAVIELARKTYRKMVQNLLWATGYNVVALPLAAGVLSGVGIVLSPAIGAVLMSASTIIVAVNARLLALEKRRVMPPVIIPNQTPPPFNRSRVRRPEG